MNNFQKILFGLLTIGTVTVLTNAYWNQNHNDSGELQQIRIAVEKLNNNVYHMASTMNCTSWKLQQ